jgi:hypothetical protein
MAPEGLEGTGHDKSTVAALAMVTRHKHEIADVNEAMEWVGLPAFEAPTDYRMIVHFESEADRERFLDTIGHERQSLYGGDRQVSSIWWPDRPRGHLHALRFDDLMDLDPTVNSSDTKLFDDATPSPSEPEPEQDGQHPEPEGELYLMCDRCGELKQTETHAGVVYLACGHQAPADEPDDDLPDW